MAFWPNNERSFTNDLGGEKGLVQRFNKATCLAWHNWIKGLHTRHLVILYSGNTSGTQAMGFNKVMVLKFNSLLSEIIHKCKLTTDIIFNCNKTGVLVNPKNQSKIIALKGQRQLGACAERRETLGICIIHATNVYF